VKSIATLLAVLVLAPAASADVPFAKLAVHQPMAPDCAQPREDGVKLQTRRACTAAAEWGEWSVESGEAWDYSRPDCDRLSRVRVRCDVVLELTEPGVTPAGKMVDRWRFTTILKADRGCVNLRVWGEGYGLRCWL
jgi:hypothetical protein